MDSSTVKEHITSFVKKYRYMILILFAGILLMLLPQKKEQSSTPVTLISEDNDGKSDLQNALKQILSKIEGAGRVEVLLTQAAGEETVYQSDSSSAKDPTTSDVSMKTVIITNENRSEQPVVRQILPPVYLGAVIVCDGGDSPAVQLAVVQAVSSATGLSADKITVLKMK